MGNGQFGRGFEPRGLRRRRNGEDEPAFGHGAAHGRRRHAGRALRRQVGANDPIKHRWVVPPLLVPFPATGGC